MQILIKLGLVHNWLPNPKNPYLELNWTGIGWASNLILLLLGKRQKRETKVKCITR